MEMVEDCRRCLREAGYRSTRIPLWRDAQHPLCLALTAEDFTKHGCDFTIGTNDLTQYTHAADWSWPAQSGTTAPPARHGKS